MEPRWKGAVFKKGAAFKKSAVFKMSTFVRVKQMVLILTRRVRYTHGA